MNARTAVAVLLAFAVPGAGHFFLGRRARAAAFFFLVVFLFAFGLWIDGALYTFSDGRGHILTRLGTLASMGSGALYFIARATGPHGSMRALTYEYGRTFTLTAGLMNLLLMLDAWDIAQGRKTW